MTQITLHQTAQTAEDITLARITIKALQEQIALKDGYITVLEREIHLKNKEVLMYERMRNKSSGAMMLAEACSRSIDASAHTITALTSLIKKER